MKTSEIILKSTLIIILLLVNGIAYAQHWEWAKGTYGVAYKTEDVAADSAGNVFMVHFDGYNFPSFEDRRLVVSKKNAQGGHLWAKVIVSSTSLYIAFNARITTDKAGNLYLLGQYQSAVQVGNITLQTPNPASDLNYTFIVKLDPQGNILWAKNVAGPTVKNPESGVNDRDIAIDSKGNIVITGAVKGNAYFDDIALLSNNPEPTAFVAKYNKDGNVVWAQRIKNGQSYGGNLDTDNEGNIYTTGYFYSTTGVIAFDSTYLIVTSPGVVYYLAKLNPRGGVSWGKVLNPTEDGPHCTVSGLAASANGKFYITGDFTGTYHLGNGFTISATSPNGNADIMVAGFNTLGEVKWARSAGSAHIDLSFDIDVDQNGNCYVVGSYQGPATFDTKTLNSVPPGGAGGFVARYTSNGTINWVVPILAGNFTWAYRISVTPEGAGNVLSTNKNSGGLTFSTDVSFNYSTYNAVVAKIDGNAKIFNLKVVNQTITCKPCSPLDPVLDYEYRFWLEKAGTEGSASRRISDSKNRDEIVWNEDYLEIELHDELTTGIYYFQLRAILGDGSITDWSEPLAFEMKSSGNAAFVYPNPVQEKLTIEYKTFSRENIQVSLYDRNGRVLLHQSREVGEGKNVLEVSVPRVNPEVLPITLKLQSKLQGTSAYHLIQE